MRYVLDFGSAAAGSTPTFSRFARLDTLAAVAQPTITEVGGGIYYFDWDWSSSPATSIVYKVGAGAIELSDVISGGSASGSSVATPGSTFDVTPYEKVGMVVARAAVQAGIANMSRTAMATYDPFASTDPNIQLLLEKLDTLGADLATQVRTHLQREFTVTTAGGALAYVMPSDFGDLVDDTQWNNSGIYPMSGPITAQEERYFHAWNGVTTVRIPYRLLGNRLTFVVDPGDGLTLSGLYHSRCWVATSAAGAWPDAYKVTKADDYVCFDPALVVLGLVFKFQQAKGHPGTALALAEYERRLEYAKQAVMAARALSLNGRGQDGFRFIDNYNLPITGWGLTS